MDEAQRIARTLVDERIVACVNIVPGVMSIYRWQGEICTADEWQLLLKVSGERIAALQARLPELHSYECPELICLRIDAGLPEYLQWICEQ